MTNFIELTGVSSNGIYIPMQIATHQIGIISPSLSDKYDTIILVQGKDFYVKQSESEIKALIKKAEQPHPYQTK